MDIKIVFAIVSAIIGIASFIPYLQDIFKRKTKPHAYTWLIWVITQGTAAGGIWYGGGGIGALGLVTGNILVFTIFLLSFKYGTRNITKTDTAILIIAFSAIFLWWKLENPLGAVLMVSAVDLVGYIPSFRKSFHEPWSETVASWIGFTVGNIFTILALREYNLLTLSYIVTIAFANVLLAIFCIIRRRYIPLKEKIS